MKYYHGSSNPYLEELTTDHYGGHLYVTDSYEMALLYAACPLRSWSFDEVNNILYIIEMGEKAFEKMYKGKRCYIYTCDIEDVNKDNNNISLHTYTVNHNVKLNRNKEIIEDAYLEFMELEKENKIKMIRWSSFSKEEQKNRKRKTIERWTPYMEEQKKNFPEVYEVLVNIIPELKFKKI